MSVGLAAFIWVVLLVGSKVAQLGLFPAYRKTWKKWDRIKDPIAWKLIRAHPFHELGWYVFAGLISVGLFNLIAF